MALHISHYPNRNPEKLANMVRSKIWNCDRYFKETGDGGYILRPETISLLSGKVPEEGVWTGRELLSENEPVKAPVKEDAQYQFDLFSLTEESTKMAEDQWLATAAARQRLRVGILHIARKRGIPATALGSTLGPQVALFCRGEQRRIGRDSVNELAQKLKVPEESLLLRQASAKKVLKVAEEVSVPLAPEKQDPLMISELRRLMQDEKRGTPKQSRPQHPAEKDAGHLEYGSHQEVIRAVHKKFRTMDPKVETFFCPSSDTTPTQDAAAVAWDVGIFDQGGAAALRHVPTRQVAARTALTLDQIITEVQRLDMKEPAAPQVSFPPPGLPPSGLQPTQQRFI